MNVCMYYNRHDCTQKAQPATQLRIGLNIETTFLMSTLYLTLTGKNLEQQTRLVSPPDLREDRGHHLDLLALETLEYLETVLVKTQDLGSFCNEGKTDKKNGFNFLSR